MVIPDKIKVGGLTFRISESDLLKDSPTFGVTQLNQLFIVIDPSSASERKAQTFVHEVIEALNDAYHLKMEHDMIERLEGALYAFIVDNPGVFG